MPTAPGRHYLTCFERNATYHHRPPATFWMALLIINPPWAQPFVENGAATNQRAPKLNGRPVMLSPAASVKPMHHDKADAADAHRQAAPLLPRFHAVRRAVTAQYRRQKPDWPNHKCASTRDSSQPRSPKPEYMALLAIPITVSARVAPVTSPRLAAASQPIINTRRS